MRRTLAIAGLLALLVAPALSSAQEASLLRRAEQRLQERLLRRGIACPSEAFACGVLERLRERIAGRLSSSSSAPSPLSSAASSSSISSARSSSFSSSPTVYDALPDTELSTSAAVLFGTVTPIAASVEAFIGEEPLQVSAVRIAVTGSKQAVDGFLVYDAQRRLLGRAAKSGSEYVLRLADDALVIPRRVQTPFYVRAQVGSFDRNRDGAGAFGVLTVTLEGYGVWSSDTYVKPLTDAFPTFQPVAALFGDLRSGMTANDYLQEGAGQIVFDLHAFPRYADPAAELQIEALEFRVIGAGVTLTGASLTVPGSGITSACTVASSTIDCSAIPATLGTVRSDFSLELHADVEVDPGSASPQLQIVLQEPGDPLNDGDIAWNDGFSSFTWVPFRVPVVRGTYFSR